MKVNTMNRTPRTGVSRVVLALALAGSCAVAQAAPADHEEETELPPVTVSAHEGQAVPYDRTGVSVTVLDIPQLRQAGTTTLTDALTTVPGVYTMPGGGLNQRGNISYPVYRGMVRNNAVMPMMDGMRLNSSSGGGLVGGNVLARTNLFDLGNAEVLRGAEGATYGGGSMGGVLYLETPQGTGDPSVRLYNEGGSFNSYTGNLTAQGKQQQLSYFLSATYEHTNNDFEKADGSHFDSKHAGRYANMAEALRLDYDINEDNKLTFTYRREDAHFHLAEGSYDWYSWPMTETDTATRYTFRSNVVTAKYTGKVTEQYRTTLMCGYSGEDDDLSYPGSPYRTNIRNVQTEWRNAYTWDEQHTTTAGLAWERSQYTADDGAGKRNTSRSLENTYSAFAEHLYEPVKHHSFAAAARWDRSSIFDNRFTTRLSTSHKFFGESSRLFGSVGQGYRSPSAFQRSDNAMVGPYGTTIGNPNLRPERSLTADLGWEQKLADNHSVSATLFWTRLEKAILTDYSDPAYTTFRNDTGHETYQGVELAMQGNWGDAWNTGYRLSCTLTEPKDNNGRQIAQTARQVWSADIHTQPVETLTLGMGLSAASGRSNLSGEPTSKLDAYYTLRLYAQYEVNEHLSFHLRVENLTNQKFITSPAYTSYGMPDHINASLINAGTAVYAGCTVSF